MSEHFWLICGPWCGVGGGLTIRTRRRKCAELGALPAARVTRLAKGTTFWTLVPCLLLWALQWSAGDPGPDFTTWPAPQRQVACALPCFVWLALVYWVFLKGGAETLSACFGAGSLAPKIVYDPTTIKRGTVLVVVVGIAALLSARA